MRLASLALILFACSSPGGTNQGPQIMVSITPTTVAAGDFVSVSVTTQNFELVDFTAHPQATPGQGHFHVYIETKPDYLTASFISPASAEIPADTPPGAHTLTVALANNDHTLVDPPVQQSIPITVTP